MASRSPSPTLSSSGEFSASLSSDSAVSQQHSALAASSSTPSANLEGLVLVIDDARSRRDVEYDTDVHAHAAVDTSACNAQFRPQSSPPPPLASSVDLSTSPVHQSTRCCSICGRTFASDRIAKHNRVCQKVNARPVVVFNSHRQRWSECLSDAKTVPRRVHTERPVSRDSRGSPTRCMNGRWRAQHQELIRAVRQAKREREAMYR